METESSGRVLAVDDDPLALALINDILSKANYSVRLAADGAECLEIANSWNPEVIVLDIVMPGIDGIETCRQLKHRFNTSNIPVLFLTGEMDNDATMVRALEAGGNDFLSKNATRLVFLARIKCQVSISRFQEKLRKMAMIDELTGVFSRRYLFQSLREKLKLMSRRKSGDITCILIDVDHFKKVNDTLGHITGDLVLKDIASSISSSVRENDIVARFGGEEFLVVLTDTDISGTLIVAEKIRSSVERKCPPNTISLGISQILSHGALEKGSSFQAIDGMIQALLTQADKAMYFAKENGRNRFEVFKS